MPFFSARPTSAFNVRSKKREILPFLTRQIITTGYTAAGYKDGVAWRNVNSNDHATDTCTNRGDLLQAAANYTSGTHNKNNAFVWGTNGTGTDGVGAFTNTSCFNMRNNTTLTKTTSMNTAETVGDSGTLQEQNIDGEYTYSWQTGNQGAGVIQKFNLATEIHQSTFAISTTFSQGGTGASTHMGELFGYFWTEGAAVSVDAAGNTGKLKFVFATETQSIPGGNPSFHGQQKGLSSKVGKGYAGNEGSYNGGNNYRVWNYTTESVQTTVAKPITNYGEENYVMGQSKGYQLGGYGGDGQTNRSHVFTYATNTGVELGASGQPTGTQSGTGSAAGSPIGGRSSGHGFWRD
jgi:hypothetical protein